ncbi:MAG: hypothetical protein Q3965_02115 [Rothia sp. (in: high G+C Gram-positive bacteria)]|nr:hypothetical protein [Rothia sp. (in: high G+C Gram-positive bacteria)]
MSVTLDSSAQVSKIRSTLVSLDGNTQKTATQEQDFQTRDVVNNLPVRITTRYQTKDKIGSNLADLQGYTGDITIDISVENLTVHPQTLTYDLAGTSHSKNALVGVPLSIVASTTFEGVGPEKVHSEATLNQGKTNGIISTNSSGDALIQWGKILAGPSTGANATFTVDVQAENFQVPEFNIGVHTGLSTDLTTAGAVTSTFTNQSDSELELMQQTVNVVTEANQALTDASTIISQVRDNLNTTSGSLKTTTIQELQKSSELLTGRLTDLQDKMANLKVNLDESATGSQQQLIDQMRQTVTSLQKFFGTEGQNVPQATIEAGTCQVKISQPEGEPSVYSNMAQLNSVLTAYSQANIDCQQQVSAALDTVLGPEDPTADTCKDSASASCAVFTAKTVADASLLASADQTRTLIENLQPGITGQVIDDFSQVQQEMTDLQKEIDLLQDPAQPTSSATPTATPSPDSSPTSQSPEPVPSTGSHQKIIDSLDTIDGSVQTIKDNVQGLEDLLGKINQTASEAISELAQDSDQQKSMLTQNQDLADQLCQLNNQGTAQAGKLSQEEVDHLRSYLTDTPCAAPTGAASPTPSSSPNGQTPNQPAAEPLAPVDGYPAPMDQRLTHQKGLWEQVLNSTNVKDDKAEVAQEIAAIRENLTGVTDKTKAIRDELAAPAPSPSGTPSPETTATESAAPPKNGADEPVETNIQAVKDASPRLQESIDSLEESMNALGGQQAALEQALTEISQRLSPEELTKISDLLGEQARNVEQQRQASATSISDLFAQQVTALSGSATSVSDTADSLLENQSDQLSQAAQQQEDQVSQRTKTALEAIQQSHDAATQDLAGTSTLLTQDLQKIMLDVGDTSVTGSGLLGSLLNNASNADNANYQLALATQNAEKYSNLREQDMGAVKLKQAQYQASLEALATVPTFSYKNTTGATVKTIYTFTVAGDTE